jgi:CRP/FNR family cyclic AMP-dependent transcriptional regulator
MVQRLRGVVEPLPLAIVRPGHEPVRQGQPCAGLWVVESGLLRLSLVDGDGHELAELLGPGDLIGEPEGASSAWSVRALRPSRLRPCPTAEAVAAMATRARRFAMLAHELTTFDVRTRIERRLRDLAARFGRPLPGGAVSVGVKLTQDDLAAFTGTTRESVNRALQALRAEGLLSAEGRGRYVLLAPMRLVSP